jgi:WD40 repeat protein
MPDAPAFDRATLSWTLPWEDDWVTAVAFAGRRLAAGNNEGHVLVWDLPEKPGDSAPTPARRLEGHTNSVTHLAATPDGRWLISSSYDHSVRCWDLEAEATGSAEVILDARSRAEKAKKLGNKAPPPEPGVKVAVQSAQRVLEGHRDWVSGLALSGDGSVLASGDEVGQVILWDQPTGKELRRWPLKGWAYALAFTPDAKHLLVTERVRVVFSKESFQGVRLWDVATGQVQRDLGELVKGQEIAAAAFSPDGTLLALGRGGEVSEYGKITVVDVAAGKKLRELAGHLNGVTDVHFSADGKHILSSGRDTVVRVWDAASDKRVAELGKPRGGQSKDWIHAFAVSADQRWLAAADMMGQVLVYAL